MEFRKIDKTNYMDCICLKLLPGQEGFVADNARSLVEAFYEEGLHTRGIYENGVMIGFVLYDYDEEIPGWSMSRFMIGAPYQGKGYGKRAVTEFLEYFKKEISADKIYISVELDNTVARNMYIRLGFRELDELSYTFDGVLYREIRMVKQFNTKEGHSS